MRRGPRLHGWDRRLTWTMSHLRPSTLPVPPSPTLLTGMKPRESRPMPLCLRKPVAGTAPNRTEATMSTSWSLLLLPQCSPCLTLFTCCTCSTLSPGFPCWGLHTLCLHPHQPRCLPSGLRYSLLQEMLHEAPRWGSTCHASPTPVQPLPDFVPPQTATSTAVGTN